MIVLSILLNYFQTTIIWDANTGSCTQQFAFHSGKFEFISNFNIEYIFDIPFNLNSAYLNIKQSVYQNTWPPKTAK